MGVTGKLNGIFDSKLLALLLNRFMLSVMFLTKSNPCVMKYVANAILNANLNIKPAFIIFKYLLNVMNLDIKNVRISNLMYQIMLTNN